ncbi:recombination protein NinB [Candidatus Kaiserbacteria bacterium]|nr:recombination protein NinB [Candidatus Kaiserbacteria bacterium]
MSEKKDLQVLVSNPTGIGKVVNLIEKGLGGGQVLVILTRPWRSMKQNRKFHTMISDIARQVEFEGRSYTAEVWKALLVHEFEKELLAMGYRLRRPSRTVISLDGMSAVTVRASTARMKTHEINEFIEYLYKFGAEAGVCWSNPAERAQVEYFDNYIRGQNERLRSTNAHADTRTKAA